VWNVARIGEKYIGFLGISLRETEIMEYLGVDERIILK
jgi:hypothetical protein